MRVDGGNGERSDRGIDERIDGSVNGGNETMMEHTGSQVDSRGRCEGEGK